jgi:hypothetical protein
MISAQSGATQITKECIFGTDGFSAAIGSGRPIVDAARNPIIVRVGFSEVRFQKVEGLVAQVEAGMDAEAVQPSVAESPPGRPELPAR